MSFDYGPFLDSLIIVLLVATIVYASVLNRRLTRFRDNRVELEKATRSFADAALRADAGIKSLRNIADETGRVLNERLVAAQQLRDDLAVLVDSGERLASRLDGGYDRDLAAKERTTAKAASPRTVTTTHVAVPDVAAAERAGAPAAAAKDGGRPDPVRRAEPDRDLLKAIEEMR